MLEVLAWSTVISAVISGIASTATRGMAACAARTVQLVRERFAGDEDATASLERARYHPHDPTALKDLDRQLERHAGQDPQFRQALSEATRALDHSRAATHQTLGDAAISGPAVQVGRDNYGGVHIGSTGGASPPG